MGYPSHFTKGRYPWYKQIIQDIRVFFLSNPPTTQPTHPRKADETSDSADFCPTWHSYEQGRPQGMNTFYDVKGENWKINMNLMMAMFWWRN